MSKPMTRITISLLIALALVAAIYSSVQGANLSGGQVASASVSAEANFSSSPTSIQEFNGTDDLKGDCDRDSTINPEDY